VAFAMKDDGKWPSIPSERSTSPKSFLNSEERGTLRARRYWRLLIQPRRRVALGVGGGFDRALPCKFILHGT
jgi:hypothetical protein